MQHKSLTQHEPIYFMPTKHCGRTIYWKDSPAAPATPDYTAAAQATADGNLEAAKYQTQANRANQTNPWGSMTWTQGKNEDGTDNNQWSQNTTLTPEAQSALDSQMAVQSGRSDAANTLLKQVQGQISTPVDLSSVGDLKDIAAYDPSQATQFGQASFNAQKAMLDPQYAQAESKMRNNLALQGLSNSSEAFNNDMSNFYNSKDLAYNQLANQSLLTGQQVAQSNYQTALAGTQAQNQTQEQKIQELMSKYNTPLNQLNSLLTGQQVSTPQFSSYSAQGQTGGADLLGATTAQGNYNQGLYNAQSAATSSANASTGSALGTAAIAAAMFY